MIDLENIDIAKLKEELKRRKALKHSIPQADSFIEQDKRDKERVEKLLQEQRQKQIKKRWSI